MDRLTILVGRLYKSAPPINYLFKVPLVGRFVPLVSGIGRPVESPLKRMLFTLLYQSATLTACPMPKASGMSLATALMGQWPETVKNMQNYNISENILLTEIHHLKAYHLIYSIL